MTVRLDMVGLEGEDLEDDEVEEVVEDVSPEAAREAAPASKAGAEQESTATLITGVLATMTAAERADLFSRAFLLYCAGCGHESAKCACGLSGYEDIGGRG
jgi:hypothetical protein